MDQLDLSNNYLFSTIPKTIKELQYLKFLNLSFNNLSREIPFGGPFANFTAESFLGNVALCGNSTFGVPPCTSLSSQGSKVKQLLLRYIVPTIGSIIIFVALVIMLRRHPQSNIEIPGLLITLFQLNHKTISYQEIYHGTNNFSESNLLGTWGFGSVYKGILSDGITVAIKVLNL